jgi:hypothetical protein
MAEMNKSEKANVHALNHKVLAQSHRRMVAEHERMAIHHDKMEDHFAGEAHNDEESAVHVGKNKY